MIIDPMEVEIAYQALCDLGLSLAETGHHWTDKQREAWECADRALFPFVSLNMAHDNYDPESLNS